ncbi:FAD-binding protein [Spirochaetia bacterium]|nr:FAD-binding protein [Spirochaetia bacterium]
MCSFTVNNNTIRVYRLSALVAGSGAAGLNAADTLYGEGVTDIAVVTENLQGGTSRNTGSDKQTYYKLSLAGSDQDSVRSLAETLFAGQCMDGDIALCEAAASVPSFIKLALLGVPFPKNRYGEYSGYKTDHDPYRRATSAGPYTSKYMTEALEAQVKAKGIRIFDKMQIIRVLTEKGSAAGLVCLDLEHQTDPQKRFVVFLCSNIIWAVGGPAAIYGTSVYPVSQHGASGVALEAGVMGRNLTEWQYGLASVKPKWNVSGTYMQALPRFISTGADGGDEREFLGDFFQDIPAMLSMIFLKGYQWPFDVRKLEGSSIIDVLVFIEISRGRRVFLDFRHNPQKTEKLCFDSLIPEARDYLESAGACCGTPAERLEIMNKPALEFFRERGVDLKQEPLEIRLCAQHNNGGLAVDCWWQSNIKGFFPVGEAAATHGIYRPGGSALNAGQAGSLRAANFIAHNRLINEAAETRNIDEIFSCLETQIAEITALAECKNSAAPPANVTKLIREAAERMSLSGAAFRDAVKIEEALQQTKSLLDHFSKTVEGFSAVELSLVYRLRDILFCQYVYLSAMDDHIKRNGGSRGSALYHRDEGVLPHPSLPEQFRYIPGDGGEPPLIQEAVYQNGGCVFSYRPPRPIPQTDDFFEKVWDAYRSHKNVY